MAVDKQDICQEEGSFTYNWVAGDAIEKGDTVEMHSDGKAYKGVGTDPFVGVADYGVAIGKSFAAYGPSNKVWARTGTTGLNVGDYVKVDANVDGLGGFTTGTDENAVGVCVEIDGTACKVLLY